MCARRYGRELESEADRIGRKRLEASAARDITARWQLGFAQMLGEWADKPQRGPNENPARTWIKALCHSDARSDKERAEYRDRALLFLAFTILREILSRFPAVDPRKVPYWEREDDEDRTKERKIANAIAGEIMLRRGGRIREHLGVERLPSGARQTVGMALIDLAREYLRDAAGREVFKVEAIHDDEESQARRLVPTEAGLSLLWGEHFDRAHLLTRPRRFPMPEKPRDWTAKGRDGGYRSLRLSLVRKRGRVDVPQPVLDAVNRLQRVPWRINLDVLRFVQGEWERGGGRFGIPWSREPRRGSRWYSKWRATKVTLETAEKMGEPVFWLPHRLDWRGRIYPTVEYLSVEGGELPRALLEFADGKPLGKQGADALAVHGAKCGGAEATTKEAHIRWVEANTRAICRLADAKRPRQHKIMKKAERHGDPLQFYAFALEWRRYVESGKSPDFVSHLPVAQDHTCNGRQHIAALLQDVPSGDLVNLTPSTVDEEPGDLYTFVVNLADELTVAGERIKSNGEREPDRVPDTFNDLEDGVTYPAVLDKDGKPCNRDWWGQRYWLDDTPMFFDLPPASYAERKTDKTAVMTYDYTATHQTFHKSVARWMAKHSKAPQFDSDEFQDAVFRMAASYRASKLWDVLHKDQRPELRAGQVWRKWAGAVAKAIAGTAEAPTRTPVKWRVPGTRFPVCQDGWEYMEHEAKQVDVYRDGPIGTRMEYEPTGNVVPAKQRSGIAPNVIHSLDASALTLAVNKLPPDVTALGTVHDAYYSLAADAAVVADCAHRAFVEVHGPDALSDLFEQFQEQVEDVPEPPERGELDIGDVLDSEYFLW